MLHKRVCSGRPVLAICSRGWFIFTCVAFFLPIFFCFLSLCFYIFSCLLLILQLGNLVVVWMPVEIHPKWTPCDKSCWFLLTGYVKVYVVLLFFYNYCSMSYNTMFEIADKNLDGILLFIIITTLLFKVCKILKINTERSYKIFLHIL